PLPPSPASRPPALQLLARAHLVLPGLPLVHVLCLTWLLPPDLQAASTAPGRSGGRVQGSQQDQAQQGQGRQQQGGQRPAADPAAPDHGLLLLSYSGLVTPLCTEVLHLTAPTPLHSGPSSQPPVAPPAPQAAEKVAPPASHASPGPLSGPAAKRNPAVLQQEGKQQKDRQAEQRDQQQEGAGAAVTAVPAALPLRYYTLFAHSADGCLVPITLVLPP
ncbi:hypothetical protein V8C86DRAFT_1828840, partial [Haematococcus lacustris]